MNNSQLTTSKTIRYLSIILSISLGANMWFAWRWYEQRQQDLDYVNNADLTNRYSSKVQKTADDNSGATDQNFTKSRVEHAWLDNDEKSNSDSTNKDEIASQKQSQDGYKRYLKQLVRDNKFETLEYEVGLYLRKYPQDVEAMLLEAQAYYHTKPLNIALVHYHELLSKPLNIEQKQEVEKIILTNTTRVIQQFSGDGAWDVLAAFIEPLVQIDPTNRSYLIALARAYGMQGQLTLMEDTLANFVPTDPRANRLRDNVLARLAGNSQAPQNIEAEPQIISQSDLSTEKRAADVLLQRSARGHFIANVQVNNIDAQMLVDTGASTTAISDEKFDSIPTDDVQFLGVFNINTAGGNIQAPIYKVDKLSIGKERLNNISVLVLPSDNLGRFDGLLGMNVLNEFDMIFDATDRTMGLYKKSK